MRYTSTRIDMAEKTLCASYGWQHT